MCWRQFSRFAGNAHKSCTVSHRRLTLLVPIALPHIIIINTWLHAHHSVSQRCLTKGRTLLFSSFFLIRPKRTQCQKTIKIQICNSPLFHNKNNCIFVERSLHILYVSLWPAEHQPSNSDDEMRRRFLVGCYYSRMFWRSGDFTCAILRSRTSGIRAGYQRSAAGIIRASYLYNARLTFYVLGYRIQLLRSV